MLELSVWFFLDNSWLTVCVEILFVVVVVAEELFLFARVKESSFLPSSLLSNVLLFVIVPNSSHSTEHMQNFIATGIFT